MTKHAKLEQELLEACLKKIEDQLGWGPSEGWSTRDFEYLRKQIYDKNGTYLSVATLKRLWGKIQYNSFPTATTLDTLAAFIGYENWQVFTQNQDSVKTSDEVSDSRQESRYREWPILNRFFFGMILLSGFLFFLKDKTDKPSLNPDHFQFSVKQMELVGVPNSVIFAYNALAADEEDTIFIQQSWDERLRRQVAREQEVHTSVYYYPGYFTAKLIVDTQIVQEHPLFIPTNGWLPIVELEPVPLYFEETEAFQDNGTFGLTAEQIQGQNIPLLPKPPWTSYHFVGSFGDLTTTDFSFTTLLKNEYEGGVNVCQHTEVHLLFEGGAFIIPLTIKGCVSEIELTDAKGKKRDPAVLGVDFSDWVKLEVKFKGREGRLYINDQFAYSMHYPYGSKKIIGLRYRFQGTGSVKEVYLTKFDGSEVYRENFRREE